MAEAEGEMPLPRRMLSGVYDMSVLHGIQAIESKYREKIAEKVRDFLCLQN